MATSGKTGKRRTKANDEGDVAIAAIEADAVIDAARQPGGQSEPARPAATYHGYLESINPERVTGWCFQADAPRQRLVVEFLDGNQVLGIALANLMREDLQQAGIGDGGHGFCWLVPPGISHEQLAHVQARVLDTEFLLENQCTPDLPAPESSINVDSINARGICGWVRDHGKLAEMYLTLEVDGEVIDRYPALLFREDVKNSGLDSGRFGFVIPLPDKCFESSEAEIRLLAPDLNEVLELELEAGTLQLFTHGHFQVADGVISGRLHCADLEPDQDKLELLADENLLTVISLPNPRPQQFSFQHEMPMDYNDGKEHRVAIAIVNSGMRLCAMGDQASFTYRSSIKGKIDNISKNGVEGWVFDVEQPHEDLEIDIYDGDRWLASTVTNLVRGDVNRLYEVRGNHGFSFVFPKSLFDSQPHMIRVLYRGQGINRKAAHTAPIILTEKDFKEQKLERRYGGRLEITAIGRVSGWACDYSEPDRPLDIAIYVDNQYIGTVCANRFAARLRGNHRNGHHVFLLDLPSHLMNGQTRQVKAVVIEANYELPHIANTIKFPLVDMLGAGQQAISPHFTFPEPPSQYRPGPGHTASWDLIQAQDPDTPLISIIMLTWNGIAVLRDCLESFLRVKWHYSYELIVVDHGSLDGSLELLDEYKQRLPLRVIARGANYSFSASNNLAAKSARGRLLVFANNDLVMLHDCFNTMAQHLLDQEVGAVGLKLLEPLRAKGGKWEYITHHQGVKFAVSEPLPDSKHRYYVPMEIGEDPTADLAATYDLPITTGALLMCRSEDFAAIGGYCEGYFYGMEDVDLCLLIKRQLNKKILCDTSAVCLHNRSATRDSKLQVSEKAKFYNAKIHANNRKLYIERFGRHLTRPILHSVMQGDHYWRKKPLRVVLAVTSTDMSTPAGDLFTALELGEAMHRLFGWDVLFADHDTHLLPGADVLIAMRHDYEIQKIQEANPGLVTVGWARNRIDEWINAPYFGAYQLLFCSSQKAIDHVREVTGRESYLLPIATNAMRFAPQPPAAKHTSDVTFTGSYWLEPREAISLQDLGDYEFAIYGHGWDKKPEWAAHWRGAVAYSALPEIYSSASIVLDDSHPVTRAWNSLNSRVFDAIGCGRLVVTNCSGGAQELFPGLLPHFDNAEQLQAHLRHFLEHPEEREELAYKLQAEVLAKHTYDNRAQAFRAALVESFGRGLRFAIKIGVPSLDEKEAWGDYHFALGIQRALEKQGHFARIDILPDWNSGLSAGDDVVIVLRGLSQYTPQPTALNLMWLISHPDDVKLSEFQQYDHVFVASESYAERLRPRLQGQVSPLLQCTDPRIFYREPETEADLDIANLLFVGNSRGQRREGVQYALEQDLDFCVWGELWETMLPPARLRDKHIPNQELRRYYSSANLVLNDHWPDMRSEGFISNRIFDAGACGAMILTDEMEACRKLFGDALGYYDSAQSLKDQYEALLADPEQRQARGEQLRKLIADKHTFDNRVSDILSVVHQLNSTLKAA